MKNVYRYVLIIDIRIYIHVKCTYVLLVDIYIYIEICCTVSMYAYCYNWYVVDRRGNVTAPFSQTSLRNRPSLPNMKRWCCQPWNHGTVPTAWVVTAGDIKFQMWPFFTCRSVHTFVEIWERELRIRSIWELVSISVSTMDMTMSPAEMTVQSPWTPRGVHPPQTWWQPRKVGHWRTSSVEQKPESSKSLKANSLVIEPPFWKTR